MKKIMWIVAVLPVVVASMMLQVIPDMIPHKIGIFIFPIVILCVTFFWHLLIGTFEKKTVKASTDKERMDVKNAFDENGLGAIINSSRGIMCAWKKQGLTENDFAKAAYNEAVRMRDEIIGCIGKIKK